MNTEQLETFLALAETKNFSRCAQRLIISQSAVSKRIFELEKELGQTLFHRSGGVALTGEGRAFRPYAEQMLNLREQAAERLKRSSQYASHLFIGCTYAYYDMRLGAQIDGFAGKNPGCSVKVRLAHSGQLIGLLLKSALDVAFTHSPIEYPEYTCESLGEEEVILVTGSSNAAHPHGISGAELQTLDMVDSNFLYAPTRLRLFPPPHQAQLSVDIASCAIPLIRSSGRFALLPRGMVEAELRSGTLREVIVTDERLPPVRNFAVYRTASGERALIERFLSVTERL